MEMLGQQHEEEPTLREKVHWAALGLGCVWFINDSIFLQVPYWIGSQPEGLKLPNWIALTGSVVSPAVTLLALILRRCLQSQLQNLAVPALIALSIMSCALLGSGLWRISSWFIYLATACAVSVGTLVPLITVPWIQGNGYKTPLISAMYLGGSLGSLFAGILAIVQSPGDKKRFSPQAFFIVDAFLVCASIWAYVKIRLQGIGLKERLATVREQTQAIQAPVRDNRESLLGTPSSRNHEAGCACLVHLVPEQWDVCLPRNWRRWIGSAWPMACWTGFVGMCTWSIARSMMGFAATHTVIGHHKCRDLMESHRDGQSHRLSGCALFCAQYTNHSSCIAQGACVVAINATQGADTLHATCTENRGEFWVGWMTSLAQFAFSAGILGT